MGVIFIGGIWVLIDMLGSWLYRGLKPRNHLLGFGINLIALIIQIIYMNLKMRF